MEYATVIKNNILTSIIAAADAGPGNAYVTIRAVDYNEPVDTTEANLFGEPTRLALIPLQKPCATLVTVGSVQIDFNLASTSVVLEASGIAARWRLHDSAGNTIIKGDVSELSGRGSLKFSTVDWEFDGVTSMQLTQMSIALS